MSERNTCDTNGDDECPCVDRKSLLWGLDRLALWGELDGVESADAHVRGEAAASAKITIEQIAWELRNETDAVNNAE